MTGFFFFKKKKKLNKRHRYLPLTFCFYFEKTENKSLILLSFTCLITVDFMWSQWTYLWEYVGYQKLVTLVPVKICLSLCEQMQWIVEFIHIITFQFMTLKPSVRQISNKKSVNSTSIAMIVHSNYVDRCFSVLLWS